MWVYRLTTLQYTGTLLVLYSTLSFPLQVASALIAVQCPDGWESPIYSKSRKNAGEYSS